MADPIQNSTETLPACDGIDVIRTTNMWITMACMAEGGRLSPDECDRTDPKRIKFVVKGTGLAKVVKDWWSGESPYRRYAESFREMKEFVRPIEVSHVSA